MAWWWSAHKTVMPGSEIDASPEGKRRSASRNGMALSSPLHRSTVLLSRRACLRSCRPASSRTLFSWFKKPAAGQKAKPEPILTEDNLFHPFSKSPFPAIKARGEAIQTLAPCPVCASHHTTSHLHTQAQPKAANFECPDCGWPTHCSEEHWKEDEEHQKYCSRLREVNEDEHDLRSGRRLKEFELPGMYNLHASLRLAHRDLQAHRIPKQLSRSRTGIYSGTLAASRRWTPNVLGDTLASFSPTLLLSARSCTSTAT